LLEELKHDEAAINWTPSRTCPKWRTSASYPRLRPAVQSEVRSSRGDYRGDAGQEERSQAAPALRAALQKDYDPFLSSRWPEH
jgi:hypothetical protein